MNRQSDKWASVYRTAPAIYDKFAKAQDAMPLINLLRSADAIASKSVLDVGTGTGKYAFLLSDNGASEVLGIDRCNQMIEIGRKIAAQKKVTNIKFLNLDAKQLNPASHFDSALSAWAINAPWDGDYILLDQTLNAVFGSLKPDGRFFLATTPPGEMAGELAIYLDSDDLKRHSKTKTKFLKHLEREWGFHQVGIRADWNFQNVDEAALCFSVFYQPKLADVIIKNHITIIRANAVVMISAKQDSIGTVFREVDASGVFIAYSQSDYKTSMRLLRQSSLRPLTHRRALTLMIRIPKLKEELKGKKWFYLAEDGGTDLSGFYTINEKGKLISGKGDVEKTVYIWGGSRPLSFGVHADDNPRVKERRFVIVANYEGDPTAPVIVGIKK